MAEGFPSPKCLTLAKETDKPHRKNFAQLLLKDKDMAALFPDLFRELTSGKFWVISSGGDMCLKDERGTRRGRHRDAIGNCFDRNRLSTATAPHTALLCLGLFF